MAKGLFSSNKSQRVGKRGKAKGPWPVMNPVPGDGDVVIPKGPLSEGSAQHSADDVQDAFGFGKAIKTGAAKNKGY